MLSAAGPPEVQLALEAGLATVTVGNGLRRNALSQAGWAELADQLARVMEVAGLRAMLVRGFGLSFCAGSDLNDWREASLDEVDAHFTTMEAACSALEQCPVPVITAIRGDAVGAGCQLALAGDVRLACSDARMGMPVLRLGIQLSPRFAARLVEQAGPQLAADLIFSGRLVSAGEAVERGLVARVAEPADWDQLVSAMVRDILALPPGAARAAKQALSAQRSAARGSLPAQVADHWATLSDLRAGVERFLRVRRDQSATP